MGFTRGKATMVGLAAVVAGAIVGAPPASAAGGGCKPYADNGWNISVCSSDNGVRVSGDVYVNRMGSKGRSCAVYYGLFNETEGKFEETQGVSCKLGRTPEIHTPKRAGYRYFNYGWVVIDEKYVPVQGKSPVTY